MSTRPFTTAYTSALLAIAMLLAPVRAHAQLAETPVELRGVDVYEHLNDQVPLDTIFRDSTGRMVTLGQFLDGRRPVVLNLAYYRCPMLCSMVVRALVNGLRQTQWTAGEQYQVVTISIDPRETPEIAAESRARALREYGRAPAEHGWHFLVGDQTNVRRLADAVGWSYRYDSRVNEYAHPAAIMLLTPTGRVARYLYGISYEPNDLRFGLLEASEGRSITTVERVLMWCYHYDPRGRRYILLARRVMQLGGVATLVVLAIFFSFMWRRERRRRRERADTARAASITDTAAPLAPASDPRG